MFYWIAIAAAAADQISKLLIRSTMKVGETYAVWPGIVQFTYYQNSGAARSTFQGYGTYFGIFAVLFIIAVLYYRKFKMAPNKTLDFGLAMLVAGAAGNAAERLLFGKVTDFLQFGARGGILNLADISINIGVLVIIVHSLFAARKQASQKA